MGSRSLEEVRSFTEGITDYLISLGSVPVVIACNTAVGGRPAPPACPPDRTALSWGWSRR